MGLEAVLSTPWSFLKVVAIDLTSCQKKTDKKGKF